MHALGVHGEHMCTPSVPRVHWWAGMCGILHPWSTQPTTFSSSTRATLAWCLVNVAIACHSQVCRICGQGIFVQMQMYHMQMYHIEYHHNNNQMHRLIMSSRTTSWSTSTQCNPTLQKRYACFAPVASCGSNSTPTGFRHGGITCKSLLWMNGRSALQGRDTRAAAGWSLWKTAAWYRYRGMLWCLLAYLTLHCMSHTHTV